MILCQQYNKVFLTNEVTRELAKKRIEKRVEEWRSGGKSLLVFIFILIQFGHHAPFENQSER